MHATVCESRPLFEGVRLAKQLQRSGACVTVITDAQAGLFMDNADCVIVGADAITEQGVVNKVTKRRGMTVMCRMVNWNGLFFSSCARCPCCKAASSDEVPCDMIINKLHTNSE